MNAGAIGTGMTVLVLAASVSLRAHHSRTAEYDPAAPVVLIGRITAVEWMNPHSFIEAECKTPDGKVETWRVEVGPPSALAKNGITRDLLAIGAVVKINGVRAKNGSTRAWGADMTFSDGKPRMTDEVEGAVRPNERDVPLTFQGVDIKPATTFDLVISSAPFLPYVLGALPVVVLLAGLFVLRRQRSRGGSMPQ